MSYQVEESPLGHMVKSLLITFFVGVLFIMAWNVLVFFIFRFLGFRYITVLQLGTVIVGWLLAVCFLAPALAMVQFDQYTTVYPNAWMWYFLTIPLGLLFAKMVGDACHE